MYNLYAQGNSSANEIIQNINICLFHRHVSVEEQLFQDISLIFLVVFAMNFDAMFSDIPF